jgi:cytoskeletal protein CcmA (bactofilin family)
MKFENIINTTGRKESFFLSKEMVITGTVKAEAPGQIAGIINGEVVINNKLVILKEGIILGDVAADELMVYGRIDGDVKCTNLIIQSGALIKGNITTITIHIEKDAIIEGNIIKAGNEMILHKKKELPKKKEPLPVKKVEPPSTGKKETGERSAWF